ncbi:MAG TPA: hypothetical protein VFD48_00370 [Pyrinomonadaceae bacterium]|nr:hypothetical protein [Pyrinomonadaceae bacterium]
MSRPIHRIQDITSAPFHIPWKNLARMLSVLFGSSLALTLRLNRYKESVGLPLQVCGIRSNEDHKDVTSR